MTYSVSAEVSTAVRSALATIRCRFTRAFLDQKLTIRGHGQLLVPDPRLTWEILSGKYNSFHCTLERRGVLDEDGFALLPAIGRFGHVLRHKA